MTVHARDGRPSTLPPMTELAARVRAGEDLRDIATQLGVAYSTLTARFSHSGFTTTGESQAEARRREMRQRLAEYSRYFEPWVKEAACRSIGTEVFYPETGDSWVEALRVCNTTCSVRLQCLDWAMRNEEGRPVSQRYGVYGGQKPFQRKKYEPEWLAEREGDAA